MGVQPQPIPPIYAVNVAVEAILKAAEGDLRDVYVGGASKLLSVVERINPAALDVYQTFRDDSSQKTDWPKFARIAEQPLQPGGPRWRHSRGFCRRSQQDKPIPEDHRGWRIEVAGCRRVSGHRYFANTTSPRLNSRMPSGGSGVFRKNGIQFRSC